MPKAKSKKRPHSPGAKVIQLDSARRKAKRPRPEATGETSPQTHREAPIHSSQKPAKGQSEAV